MKALFSTLMVTALLIATQVAFSQSSPELTKGDKHFDQFEFTEALYSYQLADEQFPNSPIILRKIADTYRLLGDLPLSTEWYRRTLEVDASNPDDMIHYAEALKSIKEYETAIEWYEKYNQIKPSDRRALSHMRDKYYFEDLQMDSVKYEMKKLAINNADPAIGISFFEDRKFLVSAVNLDQSSQSEGISDFLPYLDIYVCEMSDGNELINPIRLPQEVNSKFHDGPAYYSFRERTLYITRNNERGGKLVRDKNGSVNLKIYSSLYNGNTWSSAKELAFNSDEYSNGQPCVSKDGNSMYFTSNRQDGYGGTDIYMCSKLGGEWSEPVNLGSSINTEGDEMFPYISEDGRLFFSSDGHAGLGGLDNFKSSKKAGVWSRPINIGFPINSNQDDFGIIYDSANEQGYFCSNRDGKNNDDIYSFDLIKLENMILAGNIKSSLPHISLAKEKVVIRNVNTGVSVEKILDSSGSFFYEAKPGEKIEVHLTNVAYFDTSTSVYTYEVPSTIDDPYKNLGDKEIEFQKLPPIGSGILANLVEESETKGTKGALADLLEKQGLSGKKSNTDDGEENPKKEKDRHEKKNPKNPLTSENTTIQTTSGNVLAICFDFDKSSVRPDAEDVLARILDALKTTPTATVRIEAFCDSRGTEEYNTNLSKERAQSVKKYLTQNGIPSRRIDILWHGEHQLKNQCDDLANCEAAEHEINRRAEITIVADTLSENNH